MHDWLLELWDAQCSLPEDAWAGRMHVRGLPGWAYARALALFTKEESKHDTVCRGAAYVAQLIVINQQEHIGSSSALIEAVRAFPSVVCVLADKADLPLPGEIRGHRAFRIHPDSSYALHITCSAAI